MDMKPLDSTFAACKKMCCVSQLNWVEICEELLLLDGAQAVSWLIQERFNVKVNLRFLADWRNALWIVVTYAILPNNDQLKKNIISINVSGMFLG